MIILSKLLYESFRLRETVVTKKSGEPNLGHQRKQRFFHETTREQRSRRENWTTRVQIALRVFFIHMKFRISEPPEGAPKGAGDMDMKQVRNRFKPNNLKSKMPNINPIDYISPPLENCTSERELRLLRCGDSAS